MKKGLIYTILFVLSLAGCKKIGDAYLGVPLQPRFDENTFVPGLNIFGVIRPDSTGVFNNSFVEIQKVIPAIGTTDSFMVDTTQVLVELISGSGSVDFCQFELTDFDSTFSQVNYRPSCNYAPKAGDVYMIECTYMDLPVLTAYTHVPNKAEIIKDSLIFQDQVLTFVTVVDTSIFMLDAYCYSNGVAVGFKRLPASVYQNTHFLIETAASSIDSIEVYSYDYNLTNYMLESNTSLNFNKYRESYSVVANGYGVFGSVNRMVLLME